MGGEAIATEQKRQSQKKEAVTNIGGVLTEKNNKINAMFVTEMIIFV